MAETEVIEVEVDGQPNVIEVLIPGTQGPRGDDGDDGEVTQAALDAALLPFPQYVSPASYGLIADAFLHSLSEVYDTLEECQAAFDGALYFVTSLDQSVDWAACKAASNAAFGPDTSEATPIYTDPRFKVCGAGTDDLSHSTSPASFYIADAEADLVPNALVGFSAYFTYGSFPTFVFSSNIVSNTERIITCAIPIVLSDDSKYLVLRGGEHGAVSGLNKPLWLPPGYYKFGPDTWKISNLASGLIHGAGKHVTYLSGSGEAVLQFDGLWYSELSNFSLTQEDSDQVCALDIDGNVPSQAYATRGVQGNTLINLEIDGGNASYAFALCRQGGSFAQGSENAYINLHMYRGDFACYFQTGFNALCNTFIGGNCQDYDKHGLYCEFGTFSAINFSFQSTRTVDQVLNGGHDIDVGTGGSFEAVSFDSCRSESLSLFKNSGGVRAALRGFVQRPATFSWSAETEFGPTHASPGRHGILANGFLWIPSNDGTTGENEPTWTDDGATPVGPDGSITTWTPHQFYAIDNASGSIDWDTCNASYGDTRATPRTGPIGIPKTANATFEAADTTLIVDATDGDLTVQLPTIFASNNNEGRICTIRRVDNSDHVVTVSGAVIGFEIGGPINMGIIPPLGIRSYIIGEVHGGAVRWLLLSTNDLSQMVGVLTKQKYNTNNDTSGITLASDAIIGGSDQVTLNMIGTLGAGANVQLPEVSTLVSALRSAGVRVFAGASYELIIMNTSSANFAWTVTTNTGWTLTGTMTIAQNTYRKFYLTFTSPTAATLQSLGQYAIGAGI